LNTEELVAKRKNADRIKQFSKQLRDFNKESFSNQPKLPSSVEQSDLMTSKKKYDSNRIRGMEYAKHIPKPKLATNSQDQCDGEDQQQQQDQQDDERRRVSYTGGGLYMDEDALQAAKLQELEAKHQQGKARLEAIKKSIK
jgi:hypothetical protein